MQTTIEIQTYNTAFKLFQIFQLRTNKLGYHNEQHSEQYFNHKISIYDSLVHTKNELSLNLWVKKKFLYTNLLLKFKNWVRISNHTSLFRYLSVFSLFLKSTKNKSRTEKIFFLKKRVFVVSFQEVFGKNGFSEKVLLRCGFTDSWNRPSYHSNIWFSRLFAKLRWGSIHGLHFQQNQI